MAQLPEVRHNLSRMYRVRAALGGLTACKHAAALRRYLGHETASEARQGVIDRTPVCFYEDDLLRLMHRQLLDVGLHATAQTLTSEAWTDASAQLPPRSRPQLLPLKRKTPDTLSPVRASTVRRLDAVQGSTQSAPCGAPPRRGLEDASPFRTPSYFSLPTSTPARRTLTLPSPARPAASAASPGKQPPRGLAVKTQADDRVDSLSDIMGQYLRSQHALCTHPVACPPPMSLFSKHACPVPAAHRPSLLHRLRDAELGRRQHPLDAVARLNKTFDALQVTKNQRMPLARCCAFDPRDGRGGTLLVGGANADRHTGGVWMLDLKGNPMSGFIMSGAPIASLSFARKQDTRGTTFLTTSTTERVVMWSSRGESLHAFATPMRHGAFNASGRLVGATARDQDIAQLSTGCSVVLDAEACAEVWRGPLQYKQPHPPMQVTFAPGPLGEALFMSEHCLWDLRSRSVVKRFDALSDRSAVAFHPSGDTLLLDDQVYDMRCTHRVLRTVPSLRRCTAQFSADGSLIYAYYVPEYIDMGHEQSGPPLRVVDTKSYCDVRLPQSCTGDIDSISGLALPATEGSFAVVADYRAAGTGVAVFDWRSSRGSAEDKDESEDGDWSGASEEEEDYDNDSSEDSSLALDGELLSSILHVMEAGDDDEDEDDEFTSEGYSDDDNDNDDDGSYEEGGSSVDH